MTNGVGRLYRIVKISVAVSTPFVFANPIADLDLDYTILSFPPDIGIWIGKGEWMRPSSRVSTIEVCIMT